MEKPGGPEGAPRRLNPKARSKLSSIKSFGGSPRWRGWRASAREASRVPHVLPAGNARDQGRPRACCRPPLAAKGRERAVKRSLALQLSLEGFHLLGECDILGHQGLDLAHGVQDRGVVASAGPAANFPQRAP